MTTAEAAQVGNCTECGATLSRYNSAPICSSCARTAEAAPSGGRWISRPTVSDVVDDAGGELRGWRKSSGTSQAEAARMCST